MWLGHYESEVKQPDLNKTKQLKMRRYHNRYVVYESEVKQPDLNTTKLLNIRRHPSCKD